MTGISRSSALAFCEAEKCRAIPSTGKPRIRRSSVTNRPIRPEAPSTRILGGEVNWLASILSRLGKTQVHLKRLRNHQPQDQHDRAEAGKAERKPAAK